MFGLIDSLEVRCSIPVAGQLDLTIVKMNHAALCDGRLARQVVDEGKPVKTGDPLAEIDA